MSITSRVGWSVVSSWPLLLAVVVGVTLRVHQITLQIIADDEWHALHAVLTKSPAYIISHFGLADYCIPLTLAFETMLAVYGLSEMIMRLPGLLAGFALLIVGPLLVRSQFGKSVSFTFAWLVAVSPLLVFYSRYARPYSISTLLAFVSALAFLRWWRGGHGTWRSIYTICAILGPYFHPSTLGFVAAPMLFGFWESCVSRARDARGRAELFWTAVFVFAGWVLLLGPPLARDVPGWSVKIVQQPIGLATVDGVTELFTGTSSGWLSFSMMLLVVAGALLLLFTRSRLGTYLLLLGCGQVAVTIVLGPVASQVPIVFARYCLASLPIFLLFVAVAIGSLEGRLHRKCTVPTGTLAVAVGIVMLFLGPLPQIYRFPNNWTNHGFFQYRYDLEDHASYYGPITTPPTVPSFYVELGKQPPGTVTLLEAPWYYEWHNNPFPHFQAIHRQRMIIGFVDDPASWQRAGEYSPGLWKLRFRNFVHLSQHSRIVSKGVDYVVIHKNLAAEVVHPEHRIPVDMSSWIAEYRARYGKPYYEDPQIVVFKLVEQTASIAVPKEHR